MWYYGFLFFTVVIAAICSIIALIKLILERQLLSGKWAHITSISHTTSQSEQPQTEQGAKVKSKVFMRVFTRCVLYPVGNAYIDSLYRLFIYSRLTFCDSSTY